MTLKYVGPKPIISHRGIDFDKNKEDKFVYLNIVVQLIKALDHDYIENKSYVYEADKRFSKSEVVDILTQYCDNIDEIIDKRNHSIEDEIQHHIDRAHDSQTLNDEEKEILLNNINIMHDYMIQRSINKSVYYCAIDVLASIVEKDHLDHITMPMYQTFFHVLHSLQGVLLKAERPIDTKIDIYQEDGELFVKLQVINLLQ
jgi:hypothetical protein